MNKILVILFISLITLSCKEKIKGKLELPEETFDKSEIILDDKVQYTVSFNKKHLIPNWVAWELNEERTQRTQGEVKRDNFDFMEDPELVVKGILLKSKYDLIKKKDSSIVYDRGHLCPASDNLNNEKVMEESFYISNVVPQYYKLNRGKWAVLERRCREWVKDYKKLYIVAGPIIRPKDKKKGIDITIPEFFFKAILRKDENTWRAIGYIFTQSNTMELATIDEIERKTGLNLFHNLPNNIQEKIESKIEPEHWQHWDR